MSDDTKSCMKCFNCRVVIATPASIDTDFLAKARVKSVYCSAKGFDQQFVSINEFQTSSVRQTAATCQNYDALDE